MNYDIIILGGGIVGCSIAYELSKYNFNIALIEKEYDVVDKISFVNTSIIYDGSETFNDSMANLEKTGSKLVEDACKKFNVEYNKVGALRISNTKKGIAKLEHLYRLSLKREISNVSLINEKEIYKIEPNLKVRVKNALFSKDVAIANTYDLAIAYGEVAADNGVRFKFEEEVKKINKNSGIFSVITNRHRFKCKIVIDTILDDIYIDEESSVMINNKSEQYMNYLLLGDNIQDPLNRIVINDLDEDDFIVNIPNISGGSIVGIKNNTNLKIEEGIDFANTILPDIDYTNISNVYNKNKKNLIVLDESGIENGYIKVKGSHYAKDTVAPAIAAKVADDIIKNTNTKLKNEFNDKRRQFFRFRNLDNEQRNKLISFDKRYGNIICICNQVTEGEIVEAIRRPLGARTVDGVKKRTGAGIGSCYGTYCSRKIINILAREIGKSPTEIVEDSKESKIWVSRIKEFNKV